MKRLKKWIELYVVAWPYFWIMAPPLWFGMMRRAWKIKGGKLHFWQLPKVFLSALMALLILPVLLSRNPKFHSLRKWLVSRMIRDEERRAKKGVLKNPNAISSALWWEFRERSTWQDVIPLIEAQRTTYARVKACLGFSHLYLLNARLEEAQNAASRAVQIADEWVLQNPDKAREALELRKARPSWRFQNSPVPPNASANTVQDAIEGNWRVGAEIEKVDGGVMAQWRNAHMAVGFLEEIVERHKQNKLEWPLITTLKEMQPLSISEAPFNLDFARRIGMTQRQFDGLIRRVTKVVL